MVGDMRLENVNTYLAFLDNLGGVYSKTSPTDALMNIFGLDIDSARDIEFIWREEKNNE
jgi:hypothetical protein